MTHRNSGLYILAEDGRTPLYCPDVLEWSKWMETHHRSLCRTYLGDGVLCVYTSFLGIDHNHTGIGGPLLWETMIRDERSLKWWDEQWRYSSYEEAEKGHALAVLYASNQQLEIAAPPDEDDEEDDLGDEDDD